jgi:hypothetical protein
MSKPQSEPHWLDATPLHWHLCPCGDAWEHGIESWGKVEDHTCPSCGAECWKVASDTAALAHIIEGFR